ncbi:MAG: SIS domain-containing protein [Verrucomicrobiota bacterium]
MKWVEAYMQDVLEAAGHVDLNDVCETVRVLNESADEGRTVFVIGNGGSAANASHLAQDLCKSGCRALSLTDNTAFITALSNDIGYDEVFTRQLERFAHPEDILLAISTSGKSPNILHAVDFARSNQLMVISMTGFDGAELGRQSDLHLNVPIDDVCKAEAVHGILMHMISELIKVKRTEKESS